MNEPIARNVSAPPSEARPSHDGSRLGFLARAGELLLESRTDWSTLERLAGLAVPAMADWCAIDLVDDDGRLRRVAVVHQDPAKVAIASELERRFPPDQTAGYGVPQVVRTGSSELYAEIGERQLLASTQDAEHRELISKLGGFSSAMIVPLAAGDVVLGAITFVSAESGRRFSTDDLEIAEELARRAGRAYRESRLRKEIATSERRLEGLVDSLEAIVWEADPATRQFTYVSRRVEDLLGYPVDRLLKERGFWSSIIHFADRGLVADAYAAHPGDGGRDLTYRVLAADGRTVWVRDMMYLVPGDETNGARMRGIMVDVTERLEEQRRARAQHAATRALAESSTLAEAAPRVLESICGNLGWDAGALWIADPGAGVLRCEATWQDPVLDVGEFVETTRSMEFAPSVGLPGRVWETGTSAWIPDVVADDNFPRAPVAARRGLHAAVGFPIVLRSNVLGVLEFFSRKILPPDDAVVAMMDTIGTQIGQFVVSSEAAIQLRESHARGRAMLSSALDAVVSIDAEGRVIEFNPAAERTFGYARSEVIGKELAPLIIPPDLREQHRAGFARYRATSEAVMIDQRVELTAMRSDGSTFPVEIALTVVDATPPIFTAYIRDITEEKAAETLVRESRERLAFLAEASSLLSSSLNYETVLERFANLVVPMLGDWCAVDVLEDDGSLHRVAVGHVAPEKREIAGRLTGARMELSEGHLLHSVVTAGEPVIATDGLDACGGNSPNPEVRRIVAELGCRTAMVVPLIARGRTLGTLTLVSASGRDYSSADLSLAEDVGRRAALAVDNARLYRERSQVARTLQRSLLPPHLPEIPGMEIAARYHAAGEGNEVGGDFYDLFRTSKDDWAVLIGDVCGKGADAAALTALARYTVRAAAMQARKPSRVLGTLNEALLANAGTRDVMDQRFCTVAYARLRPSEGGARVTSTSGGHPVPIIVRADGRVESACTVGTLIGVLDEPTLADRTVELGPGDLMVFYTDGITEARSGSEVFGEDGMRVLIEGCAGLTASEVAERIERAALDFQDGEPRDDIAIVVLRVRGV